MNFIELNSPDIGEEEISAAVRVLRSGKLAQGSEVLAFEEEFCSEMDSRYGIAVNSGTSALHTGLLATGVGPGDEVIVPSFTFAASANAIALTGAKPVFADIDLDTYCISIPHTETLINSKTVGIMAVHLFGHPADLPKLRDLANKYQIQLFEDAAQAHGAEIDGIKAGSVGTFSAFSFYPTKNMTAIEGGMICTNSQEVDYRSRLLRNQGMAVRYVHEIAGFNYRMTEVSAAIGRVQLEKLQEKTEQRISNASFLSKNLVGVVTPSVARNVRHVFHQYVVRVDADKRDKIRESLLNSGIRTDIYYPTPVHSQPVYNLVLDLPNTKKACSESFALPVHSKLSNIQLQEIVQKVNLAAC